MEIAAQPEQLVNLETPEPPSAQPAPEEPLPAQSAKSSAPEKGGEAAKAAPAAPPEEENHEETAVRVLNAKKVLYCSTFDINVNDWFTEYEHIEIFNARMRRNLGRPITSHPYPCRRPMAVLLPRSPRQNGARDASPARRNALHRHLRLLQRGVARPPPSRAAVPPHRSSVLPHGR